MSIQSSAAPTASPAGTAQHRDALERLSVAMDALEDDERLAIHLHYLEKDPVLAASQALGLSRSGYYKLLARARNKLSALMREVQSA